MLAMVELPGTSIEPVVDEPRGRFRGGLAAKRLHVCSMPYASSMRRSEEPARGNIVVVEPLVIITARVFSGTSCSSRMGFDTHRR